MLLKAKIYFYLSSVFLLLVLAMPFVASGTSVSTLQTISSGTLSFLDTPGNFSFSSLATSESAQQASYIPATGASSTGDLIVQDLRFDGGFSVTLQATTFQNATGDYFPCSSYSFVTFTTDASDVEKSENIIPGTPAVRASYDGDSADGETYTELTATGGDANTCEAVKILDGNANDTQGRIGTWKVYIAYGQEIKAFAPIGTYTSTAVFTLIDDTTSSSVFDSDITLANAVPATNGQIVALDGGSELAFFSEINLPEYDGNTTIDVIGDLCSDSGFSTCTEAVRLTDIYADNNAGEDIAIEVTQNALYDNAVTTLSVADRGTVYFRARLVEQSGASPETKTSTNSLSYTMNLSTGDAWDPVDDDGDTATVLTAPAAFARTHGAHTLDDDDNYDWFAVSLTSGNRYAFEGVSGSGDAYGELYSDSEGTTLVASDDDSGEGSMFDISYTAASTATYYLRVRCFTIGASCAYTLEYQDDS